MSFLIQAASSVDGQLYTWASDTRDFAGANYPGDGTPTDVVIAARQAEGESGGASSNVLLSNATSGSQDDIESTVEGVDARAIRLSGDDPVITGIAGGAPGRPLDLIASTHGDVTLAHESTSSSATNRIVTPTAADMTVASGASVALVYDSVSERWRVVGAEGGGATPGGSVGDFQFKGVSGFDAAPEQGRLNTSAVLADADTYCKLHSSVGHVTTTDDVSVEVEIGPAPPETSSYRVDVIVTCLATVGGEACTATFSFGRLSVSTSESTLSTDIGDATPLLLGGALGEGAELEGIEAGIGSGDAGVLVLELTGLAAQRITWGWEARIQYLTEEPEA